MAISAPHYRILKELQPLLPHGGTLLEIGEANWYGDVDPSEFMPTEYIADAGTCLLRARTKSDIESGNLFRIAKAFYAALFAPSVVKAIDFNGSPNALRLDLNQRIQLHEAFDLVINHGTAEHIFNIAQVFATVHNHTKPGGLMIHESPFTGWVDHGFYCLQPTLFYDLATANGYEIVRVYIEEIKANTVIRLETRDHLYQLAEAGEIPNNAMLFVVLRKVAEGDFRVPMQGVYDGRLSEQGKQAWRELR